MSTATATRPARPATARAVDYLVSLAADRTPHVTEPAIREWAATAGAAAVSAKIDTLKALPLVAQPTRPTSSSGPDVPAGRYAVENRDGTLRFYKVDRPTEGTWAGRTFVKVMASDTEYPVRGAGRGEVLAAIAAAGPAAAMARYGQEIGRCGRCGRTLTDAESRAYGIGPDCRSKMG